MADATSITSPRPGLLCSQKGCECKYYNTKSMYGETFKDRVEQHGTTREVVVSKSSDKGILWKYTASKS